MIKIVMSLGGTNLTADAIFFLVCAIQEPMVDLGKRPPSPPPPPLSYPAKQ